MSNTKTESKASQPKKRGFFRMLSSTFFDVPRWINAKQYVETNKTLYTRIKDSFHIDEPEREETFEAAMERLKLSKQDLQERLAANQRGLTIMLMFIVLLCLYGFYLIFHGSIAGALIALAVIVLSAVRAFQYSFWNFQIKNKKLGCTFREWLQRKAVSSE